MNKTLKGVVALTLTVGAAFAGAQDIQVQVNGNSLNFPNAQPQYINGRVLVPLRGIFESLNAYVSWDQANQAVHATKSGSDVTLHIGDRNAIVNGQQVMLDVPPMILDGTTMVPIRFVSESLGASVGWLEAERLVTINTTTAVIPTPPQPLRRLLIPAHAVIPATLNRAIGTVRNAQGDRFMATIDTNNMPDSIGLPSGTVIIGHIAASRTSRNGGQAMLSLVVDRLRLPSGRTIALDGTVVTIDSGRVVRNRYGNFVSNSDFTIPAGTELQIRALHDIPR